MLHAMIECKLNGIKGFMEVEHVALTQYNLKKGLTTYGKAEAEAVIKDSISDSIVMVSELVLSLVLYKCCFQLSAHQRPSIPHLVSP